MTMPPTLAMNATNAPFHGQTRVGKDSYHQHIQSLNHTKKASSIKMYCIALLIFHSETAQTSIRGLKLKNFPNLVELLSPQKNDMETQSLCFQKQPF